MTKRMPHHGGHAGYSSLVPHLGAERVIHVGSTGASRWLGAVSRRFLLGRPPGSDWWGAHSAQAELRAWVRRGSGPRVVHVMYGEDLLGLSSYLPGEALRVVATFHQPMARIDALRVPDRAVARLDALIALDDEAAQAWRARFPRLPVHALRLGVDDGFWTPDGGARARSCLVVGAHLRDFEVLNDALPKLADRGVRVDVVGVPEAKLQGALRAGVRVHARISDEVLRELYRRSGAFLLAMRRASGNNALLQAMACGCPVVCTDLPAARSYADPAAVRWIRAEDAEAAVQGVMEVLEAPEAATERAQRGVEAARAHGLSKLAARHWDVYRSLF